MGNCTQPKKKNPPKYNRSSDHQNASQLASDFTCPNCYQNFAKGSPFQKFNSHMKVCVIQSDSLPKNILEVGMGTNKETKNRRNSKEYIYEKVPEDQEGIRFSWCKVQSKVLTTERKKFYATTEEVKTWTFQQKQDWFRSKLDNLRISWEKGCSWVQVNKETILFSSIQNAKNVDMHKQIKIEFLGEDTHDAGGLLREWIHLLTKDIFSQQINLFARAHTDQMAYKLIGDSQTDQQFSCEILGLFGAVLGKALFQKIPVCSYLDRTLIRQLCGGKVTLADVHSYDEGLYQSWKFILKNAVSDDFQVNFCIVEETPSGLNEIELKENGKEIELTEENKGEYIELCIEYYCTKKVQKMLSQIKASLHKVIPVEYLAVFEPFQLQMLLYGVPFIDLQDWKENTVYIGAYYPAHKAIIWFWEFMEGLTQEQLSKFLQFCTGSGRTPVNGFKKLETNRGNQSKFTIQSRFYCEKDPFPKGHTCFNRFQYPAYPRKELAFKYLSQLITFQTQGLYGLQ